MKGKAAKKAGKRFVNLIKFNRDKTFERIKLIKGKLTQKLSMIEARHCSSLNLDYRSNNQSEENFCICKSEYGKGISYTITLNSQYCDD